MKNNPTFIDPSYSQDPLLMIASLSTLKPFQNKEVGLLPEGYEWIKPEEIIEFREEWAKLLVSLGFIETQKQALQVFDQMFLEDSNYFTHHLYAIKSLADNHLACTVGLWYGSALEGKRIHWMMTSPLDQQKGLAKAALQKAIISFVKEEPEKTLHLSTQAASWPAIILYESLGFTPYLKDSLKVSALQNQKYWKEAKEAVFKREKITI